MSCWPLSPLTGFVERSLGAFPSEDMSGSTLALTLQSLGAFTLENSPLCRWSTCKQGLEGFIVEFCWQVVCSENIEITGRCRQTAGYQKRIEGALSLLAAYTCPQGFTPSFYTPFSGPHGKPCLLGLKALGSSELTSVQLKFKYATPLLYPVVKQHPRRFACKHYIFP